MKSVKNRILSLLLAGSLIFTATACSGDDDTPDPEDTTTSEQPYVTVTDENGAAVTNENGDVVTSIIPDEPEELQLKVGFIYAGSAGGDAVSEIFESSRAEIERSLDNAKTYYVENVLVSQFPEATAALTTAGCNVIVSTSSRFVNAVYDEAAANSRVYFISFGGTQPRANLACFQGEMYKGAYVGGLAAAFNSNTNIIGIVADPGVMSVYNIVNGFALGTKEMNDKTFPDLRLNWAWGSSDAEIKEAIDDLVAQGADVIFNANYSKYAVTYCEQLGIRVIGMNYDLPELAPNSYIMGSFYYLPIFLIDQLRNVRYNMGLSMSIYFGGVREKAVRMIEYNENCREGTKEICDALYQYAFDETAQIFVGEVKDTKGVVRIEKGATLTSTQIIAIEWLANNITVEKYFTQPTLDPVESSLIVGE